MLRNKNKHMRRCEKSFRRFHPEKEEVKKNE